MAKKKIKKNNGKVSKRERNEQLTNWYIINLCWGIVGILALIAIYNSYRSAETIALMQPLMWVLTGVFAVGTVVLFGLGKSDTIKNAKRAKNYSAFLLVCTIVALWLALYNKVRPVMESLARTVLNNPGITIGSFWNVWIPIIGIGVYLIAAFIYLAVKVTRK